MRKLGIWVTLGCVVMGTGALAAAVGPEKATELLARAWMIDNRCNVLTREERDQLTGLVARAEIALAGKSSVKAARAAMAKGRAAGTAAACGFESAKSVRDVLQAAQAATVAADIDVSAVETVPPLAKKLPPPAAKPATEDRATAADQPIKLQAESATANAIIVKPAVPAAEPRTVMAPRPDPVVKKLRPKPPTPRVAAKASAKTSAKIGAKTTASFAASSVGYGKTAEAYYRELRCRKLSTRAVKAMYAQVLREHRRAVAASGRATVRQVLRAAEARAANRSC